MYFFLFLRGYSLEGRRVFPRERFSPNSKRSQKIKVLVHRIEESFIVNVHNVLEELYSLVLSFFVMLIVSLKLDRGHERFLEGIKDSGWNNQWTWCFLSIYWIVIVLVHVAQHLYSSWTNRLVQSLQNTFVGSQHKA